MHWESESCFKRCFILLCIHCSFLQRRASLPLQANGAFPCLASNLPSKYLINWFCLICEINFSNVSLDQDQRNESEREDCVGCSVLHTWYPHLNIHMLASLEQQKLRNNIFSVHFHSYFQNTKQTSIKWFADCYDKIIWMLTTPEWLRLNEKIFFNFY